MAPTSSFAVWSSWPLHADALVAALTGAGVRGVGVVVDDPEVAQGLLVAAVDAPGLMEVIQDRARAGRETVVWGGTLAASRITALRDAGASAYVSVLALPGELAEVVRQVRDGEDVQWPPGPEPTCSLTRRESEAAQAYLVTHAQWTRAEVAQGMGISERTLKAHISRVRDKAGHEGTSTREGLYHALVTCGWLT